MREAEQRILAVGFFDGVHLGHQAILRGASAALTFRAHPLSVLAPERAPRLVMTLEDRVAAIRACGVREVTVLDFTPALAMMSAADFAAEHLAAGAVRCGADWRFGRGGEGDADFLRARGIVVEVVPYAVFAGARVSSSRLRASLSRGEIEEANAMMGRRFRVTGRCFAGKGEGARLGCPTINVRPATGLAIPFGVYEVVLGGQTAIANYGLAPTMGERAWQEPVLEVHLLEGAVPAGDEFAVEFVRFLRPERKFESAEDLARQIAADCDTIRNQGGK